MTAAHICIVGAAVAVNAYLLILLLLARRECNRCRDLRDELDTLRQILDS